MTDQKHNIICIICVFKASSGLLILILFSLPPLPRTDFPLSAVFSRTCCSISVPTSWLCFSSIISPFSMLPLLISYVTPFLLLVSFSHVLSFCLDWLVFIYLSIYCSFHLLNLFSHFLFLFLIHFSLFVFSLLPNLICYYIG